MKLDESSHFQLAGMLDIKAEENWSDADLQAMLRQVLGRPIGEFLFSEGILGSAQSQLSSTSLEILTSRAPDQALVEALRTFGKGMREDEGVAMQSVRRVIYFVAIAAGKLHTSLPPEKLQEGFNWVRGLGWVDEDLKCFLSFKR